MTPTFEQSPMLCSTVLTHWTKYSSRVFVYLIVNTIEEEKNFYNEEKDFQISSIEQSPIPLHTDTNSLDWNYVFSKLKRDHFCIRNATNFRDIARWKNIEKLPYQKNNFQIDAYLRTESTDIIYWIGITFFFNSKVITRIYVTLHEF